MKVKIFISILIFFSQFFALQAIIKVNTETQRLIDEFGRERIFHGSNVVYKARPYFPVTEYFDFQYSFCEEDMKNLQEWGFNVIRLGCLWAGAEPVRGQYNETYFEKIQWIVNKSSEYGIYCLLDQHQDVYNEKFCGEGVPDWAAEATGWLPFPEPVDSPYKIDPKTGYPTPEECNRNNWPSYYPTDATSTAFQNLYDNYDSLQDSFALYWQKVASIFRDTENVLGYELINEPWAGNVFENPLYFVPGVADIENLQPMYDNINSVVRKVDDKHLIFFEPVTWDDFYAGFEHVPGGDNFRNLSVLSYHYYVPPDINVEIAFNARMRDIKRLGCGGFLTEFGGGGDDLFYHTDNNFQGWMSWEFKAYVPMTGWDYGFYYSNGSLNLPAVKDLSRTYARAIAGHGLSSYFNASTAIFYLEFALDPSIKAPTEIYLNEAFYYPKGYQVTLDPTGIATWKSPSKNIIEVTSTTTKAQNLKITINPK